jgi:hypothetical protein
LGCTSAYLVFVKAILTARLAKILAMNQLCSFIQDGFLSKKYDGVINYRQIGFLISLLFSV